MNYVGREEKKFEIDKAGLYFGMGMDIFVTIAVFGYLLFANGKLDELYLREGERQLYGIFIFVNWILLFSTPLELASLLMRTKCYISVCENGIEGRAGRYGNKQVAINYSEIADVQQLRAGITIKTKKGESYTFCIRDAALCANIIASRIGRI